MCSRLEAEEDLAASQCCCVANAPSWFTDLHKQGAEGVNGEIPLLQCCKESVRVAMYPKVTEN